MIEISVLRDISRNGTKTKGKSFWSPFFFDRLFEFRYLSSNFSKVELESLSCGDLVSKFENGQNNKRRGKENS